MIDGAGSTTSFLEFLDELEPNLVMDNVRFHHSRSVLQWVATNSSNVTIEYLPPYSPELNPIEEFFHMEKSAYKRANHPVAQDRQTMKARVTSVLENLKEIDLSGLYRDMRRYLAIAYAGQPFL